MSAPLNTISPLTYPTWLKYQKNLKPDTSTELYSEYLHEWYRNNTLLTSTNENAIRENYIQLLKDLNFLFGTQEKDLFLADLDYKNDEELIFAIPYFVKKLKEVCKVLSYKRESIKNAKLRYSLAGSNAGLETLLYEYVLKGFTKDENYITQVPISSLANFFPSLSSVSGNFFVELEELHDSQNYHDSDPSVSINQYVDLDNLMNEIPFEDLSEEDILNLLSTRYLSRVADTPLSRLFNQYLLEVPTLSTAALSASRVNLVYNQIVANQQYLGETVYSLTAVRASEIDQPDFIMNLPIEQGNNWFYWPSGTRIVDESVFNNLYNSIPLTDSSFVKSGATGGTDYTNSDLFFSDKTGVIEGAWLKGPSIVKTPDTMRLTINSESTREFIYPYPGFKLTTKGTLWNGHSLNDDDYFIYEKLLDEQKREILTQYYTASLPNSAASPIYINNSNLIYDNAYPEKFSYDADTITKRPSSDSIDLTYSDYLSGETEQAYLYKFEKTDLPISAGLNDIAWPILKYDALNDNLPLTILSDTCLPIRLSEIDSIQTMTGAVAGNSFTNSDIIYKLNTKTGDPIEAAWLGAGSIQLLDRNTNDSIPIYNDASLYCASYVDGVVQGGLSTKINAKEKTSFIWMDKDTPADEVFFYRQHAEDCPYTKTSPHNYYSNQDYQNPFPIHDTPSWTKCRCKSTIYSPIGHSGEKVTDYNGMADYLFADPQGLGVDFAFNTWLDTRGLNPLESPQFSFYKIDEIFGDQQVGWGSGFWKTGNGSRMILKTGRRYTYYRTSFRTDVITNTIEQENNSSPYLIVNYPYKNIRGLTVNTNNNVYDICIVIDKSLSQKRDLEKTITIVKDFATSLINGNVNVQISVVTFDSNALVATFLTKDLNAIKYSIENVSVRSEFPDYITNIYDALMMAEYLLDTTIYDNDEPDSLFDICNSLNATIQKKAEFNITRNIPRSNASKNIILFSDGYETAFVGSAVPYANQLKNSGIIIHSVDIGPNSYYSENMEKIASRNSYFNLQKYLYDGEGTLNNFTQYLASLFSISKLSIVPTWYKAIRNTFGEWIATTEISDMILNPGDYLTYFHQSEASYEGSNGTSFSTPAISFTTNVKLNGWDYYTNTFQPTGIGVGFGAKPFWGKSYTTPEFYPDQHFDKQLMYFGGQVRFIDGYLPVHQPEVSKMILLNGSVLTYQRRGKTNLIWDQALTLNVFLSSYQWNKIIFYKDVSNLQDMFRNGNILDLIAYSSEDPSDIILESYSSFLPNRYNYYARNSFSYTQNFYLKNKCLNTFAVFNTGVAVDALHPYANMNNVFYPTVATISLPSLAKSEKQLGEYLLPENLGVPYWRGRGYTIEVSKDTLSFIDSISAERLFLNTNKYGPLQRGLTKKDQYSPTKITKIDNRWMMESYSSSDAAGRITDTLNNQKFTAYQSKYEIIKRNRLGLSRQNDDFDFWKFPLPSTWDYPEKYPITFRRELLASSYHDRKKELLVNIGDMTDWKTDIFGTNYGLFKTNYEGEVFNGFGNSANFILFKNQENVVTEIMNCGCDIGTGTPYVVSSGALTYNLVYSGANSGSGGSGSAGSPNNGYRTGSGNGSGSNSFYQQRDIYIYPENKPTFGTQNFNPLPPTCTWRQPCTLTLVHIDENRCEDDIFGIYILQPNGGERFIAQIDLKSTPPGCCNSSCPQTRIDVPLTITGNDVDENCQFTIQLRLEGTNCCNTYTRFAVLGAGGEIYSSYFNQGGLTQTFNANLVCLRT